jgi:NitT/TauT family transport system substrate-binding protein
MKKGFLVLGALAVALTGALVAGMGAQAQSKLVPVKLQLKWFPQAQFAGFFVAKERGFFKDEGLDVTLLPSGDGNPVSVVTSGGADFGTTWITDLLVQRSKGQPIVHIAQMFQRSGFTLVTLKNDKINSLKDLKGKRVGVWPGGNEYPVIAALKKIGYTTSLDATVANPDVQALVVGFNPGEVFPGRVDAVSAMTYNELNQIIGLGYSMDKLKVFRLADLGVNLLEDLMFTTEKTLAETNFAGSGMSGKEIAAKLVRASIKGWDYAVKNQKETVDKYVLPFCGNTCKGSGTRSDSKAHQVWQMREIAALYNAGPTLKGMAGYLDPKAYQSSVKILLDQGILKEEPKGAVDYSVWEMATGKKMVK